MIVFNKILTFKPHFTAKFERDSYRKLINEIKQLFPVVIEITNELDENVKLESDFYDLFCALSTDQFLIQFDEHIKIIYENVKNIINHDNKNLRNRINQYLNEKNFSVKLKEIKDCAEQADENHKKIRDIVKQTEPLYTEHALKGFKTLYNGISVNQKSFSKRWLIGAFVFGCFLINSKIWSLIDYTNETNYIFIFANEISFNLVLLAAFLVCTNVFN